MTSWLYVGESLRVLEFLGTRQNGKEALTLRSQTPDTTCLSLTSPGF